MRSRLPFEIQRLNGRQALLGALKRGLVREREAQEEGKEKSPSSRVSRASRTPLSALQNAVYEGHRRRITVILIHHLSSRISSTLSQHPSGCLNEVVALTVDGNFFPILTIDGFKY